MATRIFLALFFACLCSVRGQAPELISTAQNGSSRSGSSSEPSVSGDGRFVTFSSTAALVGEDANGRVDVYVRDRAAAPGQQLRRISDSRGGDQPLVTTNGKFIIFRSLDTYPKLRLANFEVPGFLPTVSTSFNRVDSGRFADTCWISPDGQYAAFPLRPIPIISRRLDTALARRDTTQDGINGNLDITQNLDPDRSLLPRTLGRVAMTPDGNTFFFETFDSLVPSDQDGGQLDLYQLTSNPDDPPVRITAPQDGLPDEAKASRQPVLTVDGRTLFFISDKRLRNADTDGRATLYSWTNGVLTPIPTAVVPLALSRQAVGDGRAIVFLGQPAKGAARPYILRLSPAPQLAALAASGTFDGPPAISANNASIVFTTTAALSSKDRNGAADVYRVGTPFTDLILNGPTATLTANPAVTEIKQGAAFTLSVKATEGDAPLSYSSIEVEGVEIARSNSGTPDRINNTSPALRAGVYQIRAVTLDTNGLAARSEPLTLTVHAPDNSIALRPVRNLFRQGEAGGGAVTFAGTFEIENTFSTPRGPFKIIVSEAPTDYTWESFGFDITPTAREERIISVIDIDSIGAKSVFSQPFAGQTLPPEVLGSSGFRGGGSTITARLQELRNNAWVVLEPPPAPKAPIPPLLTTVPRLNEETPGPNGGIPQPNTTTADGTFNPPQIVSVNVAAISRVAEMTARTFTATATFSSGNPATKPVAPVWSLAGNAGTPAFINPLSGVLTVGNLNAARTIKVRATLGTGAAARVGEQSVTLVPVSPIISVRAKTPIVTEAGGSGIFRIVRSAVSGQPLDVIYQFSGKASVLPTSPSLAQDYSIAGVVGTATIPANRSSVDVVLTGLADANYEGDESIILALQPDGAYRLNSSLQQATEFLSDAATSPVPPEQPDVTIRAGQGAIIGQRVIDFDPVQVSTQIASVNAGAGQTVNFTVGFVNRSNAPQTYTVLGGADLLGFRVRYFEGATDVTAAIAAGTFQFQPAGGDPAIAPGGARTLKLQVTPTAAATLQTAVRCNIMAQVPGGSSDAVVAVVRRIR